MVLSCSHRSLHGCIHDCVQGRMAMQAVSMQGLLRVWKTTTVIILGFEELDGILDTSLYSAD